MITPQDYAILAHAPYDGTIPPGWSQVDYTENTENGFFAVAYQKDGTNEIVISYRGTNDSDDWRSNRQILQGTKPDQYKDALNFYDTIKRQNPDASLSLTGHSLGGALGSLVMTRLNVEDPTNTVSGVFFNALGVMKVVHNHLEEFGSQGLPDYSGIHNINAYFNPVSNLYFNHQVGNVENMYVSSLPFIPEWLEPVVTSMNPLLAGAYRYIQHKINALIDSLKQSVNFAQRKASPIILDLDGNGISMVGFDAGVHFDHDGNGLAERTGWVGSGDGLLVWDRSGNGVIDNGQELFGNNTVLVNGLNAVNGFAALAEHDSNGDGVIDANDTIWSELRVWVDADVNGHTGAGELLTLEAAGVQSINVSYENSNNIDEYGNAHKQVGSYTRTDGTAAAMADVWFARDLARSVETDRLEVSEEIAELPNLASFGTVRSLHQTMARDETGQLQALVEEFTQAATTEDRMVLVRQIIYHWAGVQDTHPASRTNRGWGNAIGDARKLEALGGIWGHNTN